MATKKKSSKKVRKPASKRAPAKSGVRAKGSAKSKPAKKAPAKRPTAKKAAKRSSVKKAAAKKAAKRPTAKKPAAKKPTAKKPATKKPAAKKAPAKVPATVKKPSSRRSGTFALVKKVAAQRKADAARRAKKASKPKAKKAAEAAKPAPADAKPAASKNPRLRSQPVEVQEIDVQIARARKSRLKAFVPKKLEAKPRKLAVREVCDTLNRYMGKAPKLGKARAPETVAELGIFCIFAIGDPNGRAALDATHRLVEAFPQWNEFRVSEAYEFLEVLRDLGISRLYDRCEQVLEFVNEIYQDQNDVDLEFLRELSVADRVTALNRYRSIDPAMAHYLALSLQGFEGIIFHFAWARVVQRVGLTERIGSPRKIVGVLDALTAGLDVVSMQVNLIQLGEEICQSKVLQCARCYLVGCCAYRKI